MTVSTIITDALRESNLLMVGQSPTTEETTEALRLLNRYVASLFSFELGEELQDLGYGETNVTTPELISFSFDDIDSRFVPSNTRLVCNLAATKVIDLNPAPADGERVAVIDASSNFATYNLTLNGNGRTVESGVDLNLHEDGLNRAWFYRADLGDWKRVADLTTSDDNPFPQEFEDMLVIGLALRLNPRNGVVLDAQSGNRYTELMRKFKSRYKQSRESSSELALRRLPSSKMYQYGVDSQTFNRGRTW